MVLDIRNQAAIVGIGVSAFGRNLPESQLALGTVAFKAALADAGLTRDAVDGVSIHLGWPLGVDYDRVADAFGLNLRYVNQAWLHGRFVTQALQSAALAVATGMADVVACVTAISFTRVRDFLGGPGDHEGTREEGGTHGEAPVYGLTGPASGAALAMQRYMATYGATTAQLAAVPIAIRKHALLNPNAVMKKPLSFEDHQAARWVVEPLRLFDCCPVTDGAAVVLVTSMERARDLKQPPVAIAGMQGIRAGREEFIFAPPGLGLNQQPVRQVTPRPVDLEVFRQARVEPEDIAGFYTYDAFSPLVLFALERFGHCGAGEAAQWVQNGRIELGGDLPVNTSGGLLSEVHIGGWNSICEIARQIRNQAGPRQIPDAHHLQWGTCWGDSVVFSRV